MMGDTAERSQSPMDQDFQPKPPLGRRLWDLRKRIAAAGEPLLDWDDLEREIAERRGGVRETK